MRSTKRILAGVAVTVVLAGCGTAAATMTAAEQVPALGERLERIDAAIVAHRYDAARAALRRLIAETTAAKKTGELSAETADRIIAAAKKLLVGLPRPQQPDEPEDEVPTEQQTEQPSEKPDPTEEAEPTDTPTSEAPEPSASPSGPPIEPGPSEEPTPEPSREATPTEQSSAAPAG